MDASEAIRLLQSVARDAGRGLPEEVFLFLSRMTPLVNVDLLIRDADKGFLLTWREDLHYGAGWHVPGGIVRFKEKLEHRIRETARLELGAAVVVESEPVAVLEAVDDQRDTRGHFISLLYRCQLTSLPDAGKQYAAGVPVAGQWCWHETWPEDMIAVHRHYHRYY